MEIDYRSCTMSTEHSIDIYLEIGNKKVFACAIQWPGWCRSGKSEADALDTLLAYTARYSAILQASGLGIPLARHVHDFAIVDRVDGDFSTSYGVPVMSIASDSTPLNAEQIARYSAILSACWQSFDAALKAGQGKELRKGPRGGGRELAEIANHVAYAEKGYLRHLGWEGTIPDEADINLWMRRERAEILNGIQAASRGEYPAQGPHGGKRWPLAYFFRRAAWHVTDHTWEIEDRIVS